MGGRDLAEGRVNAEEATRRRDLQRTRAVATGLLALMAIGFVVASLLVRRWPLAVYMRAFTEAGMVGACADWFAVTALFRRPLGLPIPHTAIVPRNKARIGQAIGVFVADNFLTEEALAAQLRQLELARWGGAWLRDPSHARRVAERAATAAPALFAAFPREVLREILGSGALALARAAPAAPLGGRLLALAWSEGRAQAWLDRAAVALGVWLDAHREVIAEKVEAQTYRWLPKWIDRLIAQKITAGVLQLLDDLRDPEHPWRAELGAQVERLAARLCDDPELRARGEAWKATLLADPRLSSHAAAAWIDLEAAIAAALETRRDDAAAAIERLLIGLGAWLDGDVALQTELNRWARRLAQTFVAPRRHDLGASIARVVDGWDAALVVDKLELQVGRDLQYIRINGTLVGGLAGLAIFVVARALGLPAF